MNWDENCSVHQMLEKMECNVYFIKYQTVCFKYTVQLRLTLAAGALEVFITQNSCVVIILRPHFALNQGLL